jgi:hypothetical protein
MKTAYGVYRVSIIGRRLLSVWSDRIDALTIAKESRIKTVVLPIMINHGEHARRKQVRAAAIEDARMATL